MKPSEISVRLKNTGFVHSMISRGDFHEALGFYLERYGETTARAKTEWELAKLAIQSDMIEPQPRSWPPDLLDRVSGAILAFVVSQVSRADIDLPGGLRKLAGIPAGSKKHAARAWEMRPECACLNDAGFRHRFALWLAEEGAAIGSCLAAEAERNDANPETLAELSDLWLLRGLRNPLTLSHIEKIIKIESAGDTARRAIRGAIGLFWEDSGAVSLLQKFAFELGEYESVIACGDILMNGDSHIDDPRILAYRLAALAETDRGGEAACEYETRWRPLGVPYPFPEKLLYAFQREGAAKQERHLVETGDFNELTPKWAVLSRDLFDQGKIPALVREWAGLYEKHNRDERVLAGFSRAVLALPALRRRRWAEALAARWKNLLQYEDYREIAGAFLVLFQETDEERIETFEKLMHAGELSNFLEQLAAHLYIRALCRRKKWDKLREYTGRIDPKTLFSVCPFEEYEFIRLMARVEELPGDTEQLKKWLRYWERLVSLPLESEMISEMLDHFVNLRRKLRTSGSFVLFDDYFEDISLQILRRAKAEAEMLIMENDLPEEEETSLRTRLGKARLGGTGSILRELGVYYQRERETIRWKEIIK